MSLLIAKLLALMVFPLSQSLLLLLLGLILLRYRRRVSTLCFSAAFAWLYLCSTAWFADVLMQPLEGEYPPLVMAEVPVVPVIVVLGGTTRGDTTNAAKVDLSGAADRLLYATELYKAGKSPRVLLSGGAPAGEPSEAQLMHNILLIMGVPSNAMWLEHESRTTYENAVNTAAILEEQGITELLLVTSAAHMRRARALFEHTGLDVLPAPTDYQYLHSNSIRPGWLPDVNDLERTTKALKEYVGWWYYGFRGVL